MSLDTDHPPVRVSVYLMFTGRRKAQVRSPFRAQLNKETVEYILETTGEKSI